jgi:hypothetical protein
MESPITAGPKSLWIVLDIISETFTDDKSNNPFFKDCELPIKYEINIETRMNVRFIDSFDFKRLKNPQNVNRNINYGAMF